jgi:hypothetical protein
MVLTHIPDLGPLRFDESAELQEQAATHIGD